MINYIRAVHFKYQIKNIKLNNKSNKKKKISIDKKKKLIGIDKKKNNDINFKNVYLKKINENCMNALFDNNLETNFHLFDI